ncbi:glutamate--cysteine ligase [Pelistega sp. MC2]|uniref:glutamate--cysteine ligase n=1 Tax=Pelistega sp. MC2 TaxID=1720297 RepID=UPI000B29EC85|nr:glutamate--cysteine ligase [Pelistega sp. MC2]
MQNLSSLQQQPELLKEIQRGIEREAIRITKDGQVALDKHPTVLGSALTHPNITTDYSEALIELITSPHKTVEELLMELHHVHQFVVQSVPDQNLWTQSMPCHLPEEKDIPIAEYGTSNSGTLRHVYREGLALRYGKKMQCIAGLHYNFSLPPELWQLLPIEGNTQQEKQNVGYMALIRNFKRYAWLLMYLFGASPTINGSFLNEEQKKRLTPLVEGEDHTYYLPYATSLRMSDLGYRNDAQSNLKSCFNTLEGFAQLIYDAVTTPWPAYEALGTQKDGKWIQLNGNILQIENEFYATIRPKRTHGRGERPITALLKDGIQYIEVRCIDIDPFHPLGISEDTCRFLDAFLLYCACTQSAAFPGTGQCKESESNFNKVVNYGRQPGLTLLNQDKDISLKEWGLALIEQIKIAATLLDKAYNTQAYSRSLDAQKTKLLDSTLCPSNQVLALLQKENNHFNESITKLSQFNTDTLRVVPLNKELYDKFLQQGKESIAQQEQIEKSDHIDFATYLQQFMDALKI